MLQRLTRRRTDPVPGRFASSREFRPLFKAVGQQTKLLDYLRFLIGFLTLTFCAPFLNAQQHVPEPAVNLGDTSLLDGLGMPGVMTETIADAQRSSEIVDGSGHKVPGTGQVNSILSLSHVAWLSDYRLLGGWYGAELLVPVAHVNAGPGVTAGGFGDLVVAPFIVQWPQREVGPVAIDQRLDCDFWLPSGEYAPHAGINISSHTLMVNPNYAVTLFPLRRLETSWRFHYLWSSTNRSPPQSFGARSTQAGQAVHFNATLSYEVSRHLWIGGNGYFLKQITDPQINDIDIPNSPEQVGAIGPGMLWNHREWFLYVNAYHELGAENRPTGSKIVLRLEKVFGKRNT